MKTETKDLMNQPETGVAVNEIKTLHDEIAGHFKQSLEKAIRIGQLLSEQKAELPHGKFTGWINSNLPFTDRTARNYMRLYSNQDKLKTETVSDLTEGYMLLSGTPKVDAKDDSAENSALIMQLQDEYHAIGWLPDKTESEVIAKMKAYNNLIDKAEEVCEIIRGIPDYLQEFVDSGEVKITATALDIKDGMTLERWKELGHALWKYEHLWETQHKSAWQLIRKIVEKAGHEDCL